MKKQLMLLGAMSLGLGACAVQPEPMTDAQIATFAEDKRTRVTSNQEPLTGALTLHEAMARALKYNLDKEVEVMQVLLAEQQLRVAHYSMLPGIVASTGYADRDNYSGGRSVQLLGPNTVGPESLTSSTSSEKHVHTGDIKFTWNILDFGLSWVRAKQASDKVLIAEENRRRVVHRIVENVRTAYWRAVAATRLMRRLKALEARVQRALDDNKSLIARGESTPLAALNYERELVEIQSQLRRLDSDLSNAKVQLAALVNLDPGKSFEVVVPRAVIAPGAPRLSPQQMVETALAKRSELREIGYETRINAHEAEAAILEMLPGFSVDGNPSWNSNGFLYNTHWIAWGAQASWNLIKVFNYPERRAEVEAKDSLLDTRALAITMAIMTQVHVSRARIHHANRDYRTASHYEDVQRRILEQIRSALDAGKVSEQTAIREEMNALLAVVKRDMAYAELQSSVAALNSSMGLTPAEEIDYKALPLSAIKEAMAKSSIVASR